MPAFCLHLNFIMKKVFSLLAIVVLFFASCKKSTDDVTPGPASNTLTFDVVYSNVSMTGAAYNGKWLYNAVIHLAPVGGFARDLAFNFKVLQAPTANTVYTIVNADTDITSTTGMLYINLVDYNPSVTDNISTSYFETATVHSAVTLVMVNGKATITFSGLTMDGNRGGPQRTAVAANLTQQ